MNNLLINSYIILQSLYLSVYLSVCLCLSSFSLFHPPSPSFLPSLLHRDMGVRTYRTKQYGLTRNFPRFYAPTCHANSHAVFPHLYPPVSYIFLLSRGKGHILCVQSLLLCFSRLISIPVSNCPFYSSHK